MRSKRSLYNLITSIGSQIILLLLGLVIPRLTLSNYGSETNGYMNLVGQVYAYIALLEAGLGTAEIQALYGPVASGNRGEISGVLRTARQYYRKLAFSYGGVVLLVAVALPLLVKSELSPWEMGVYFVLYGLPRILSFYMTQAMQNLLLVEGKHYISTITNLCVSLSSTIIRIALLWLGIGLIPLQIAYTACNLLEILFYYFYIRKNYGWVDFSSPVGTDKLRQRDAFFVQQICQLVFRCTDILLLSTFHGLKATSVYAVYMLIYNALNALLYTIINSTYFTMGQIYHEDFERYKHLHRIYELGYVWLSFVVYTTAYVLALPFVRLYTTGITDANYLVGAIPLLLTINNCLFESRGINTALLDVSYHAKQTLWQVVAEAVLNLGISLALVKPYGIPGVLMGTCLAAIFRLIVSTIYANRKVLHTSVLRNFWLFAVNFGVLGGVIFIRGKLDIVFTSYTQFFVAGIITVTCIAVLFAAANVLTNFQLVRGAVIGAVGRIQNYRNRTL